jgi:hypothetical protein
VPPCTVNFIQRLQTNFREIVYHNLRKPSQQAIDGQTDPKELKGMAVKVQSDIVDCTLGKYLPIFFVLFSSLRSKLQNLQCKSTL